MSKVWKTMWNIQFCGFHNSWNPRARWCPWRESHKTSFPEVKRVSSLKVLWNQSLVSGSCKMQVKIHELYCCCCSVTKSCLTLWDPMDCSTPDFPTLHYRPEFAQLMSIEWVMPSNHLIPCCLLLLLPSVSPSIRLFCNELAFHIGGQCFGASASAQSFQWIFRLYFL